MPRLASSKRPGFWPAAPVKAPFSWPNSSLSTSVSGRAAQLKWMNGACRRGEIEWMMRATSPLPVPLSPRISTVERALGHLLERLLELGDRPAPADQRAQVVAREDLAAQRLVLLLEVLPGGVELAVEPGVVDRDGRLVGEGDQELEVPLAEQVARLRGGRRRWPRPAGRGWPAARRGCETMWRATIDSAPAKRPSVRASTASTGSRLSITRRTTLSESLRPSSSSLAAEVARHRRPRARGSGGWRARSCRARRPAAPGPGPWCGRAPPGGRGSS